MTTTPQNLSPNKQALLKIRELKQQLADAQACTGEPIAIVSMACRFPRRATSPESYWKCLIDQTDEVSDIPEDRWDLDAFHDDDPEVPGKMYARRGVFLDNLDLMDPEFFGISPREATWVDPQQRLLLEVGYEALERAGWTAKKIGEHTGIFVGWMHNDYQNEASDSFLNLNPYIATGAAGSFLCGRLAYYLGLEGPAVAVDTACSSSLVALHLAIQSLQRRDCDRALVGGVNAICSPTTNILTCKLKALSPQGHSRAFDAAADGYLRGEGCGVVTLRRLSDAEQAGDSILGVIRGSAIGHNGFSSGLTAPNPKAQTKVIRQALERAKIDPAEVSYLEAHGTGTELGDPIEIRAAAEALTENRSADQPLLVGSVKTNIGHLEAAAGMAGLMKVLLSMQNDKIPGQLNFETPNPHIPWDKIPVRVLTEATAWPQSDRRIAGVSAFGMSGTNAHVVIEAPGPAVDKQTSETETARPHLIVLSAKNEQAVLTLAESYGHQISADPMLDVADVAYTTSVGREHFEYRAALVAHGRASAIEQFKMLARAGSADATYSGHGRRTPKIAWQFTGQGSQYVGMARGLYENWPVFRNAIDHCDQQLKPWRPESLIDVLWKNETQINHTSWTQPAIFAVQMGLAKLLQSWGMQPDMVMGHSVGQYAAACVAGIMSWEDGLHMISERGRLIGELPQGGKMLAVFAPLEEVQKEIRDIEDVSLAALNGTHIVVSGAETAIEQVEAQFSARKIRTKTLATSHAFHSSLMDPALASFQKVADSITFSRAQLPLICNVTGKTLAADEQLDGAYWASHIREAVRFSEGIEAAAEMGCEVILELGPQSVLTRMAAANWTRPPGSLISCLQKGADDSESILNAVGQLYVNGVTPNFEAMYSGKSNRRVLLPTYPFQRRRFWGPDKPRAFHAEYHTAHPLLGSPVSLAGVDKESRYESFIEPDSPPWLPDHEVMGNIVLPGAAYVEMAIAAAGSDQIENAVFAQPLRPAGRTALQTIIRTGEDSQKTIETFSAPAGSSTWTRNFTAKIVAASGPRPDPIARETLSAACTESAEPHDFYAKMQELGLNYGPKFQTIESLNYSQSEVLTRLTTNGDVRGFTVPPTLLDGALHSLAVGLLREDDGNLFLPVGIGRVKCYQAVENEIWCHAKWKQNEGETRTADLVLFTETGQVAVEIEDLKVQQVSIAALRRMSGSGSERLVYQLDWQNFRLPAANTQAKKWLVVNGHGDESVGAIIHGLTDKGHDVVELKLETGAPWKQLSERKFSMCGESTENWKRLFDQLSTEDILFQPEGIAWLFGSSVAEPPATQSLDLAAINTTDPATKANCTGLLNLIATLMKRGQRKIECGLQLITSDAIAVGDETRLDPEQTQYWGLGRVIGAEQPEFRCRLIDVGSAERENAETTEAVLDILQTETRDNQFAIRGGQFFVPRMKKTAVKKSQAGFSATPDGGYLITGGLGMLGRQAAKWLAENGAKQVVLVSRRSPDESTRAFLDSITETGCEVVVHSADLSSRADVEKLVSRFGDDLNPLTGVIHAAGVLDDALIGEQTWERFRKVLAPKVLGASLLHEFTKSLELDFFVLYSSAASVLGSPGQSNYATANAFLDGLAWQRRAMGLPATSINWGPWTEGMANDERIIKRLALQGIAPLTVSEAHAAMEMMLASGVVQATVMDVDWRRMQMGLGGETQPMLAGLAPIKQRSQMGDSELVSQLKRLRGSEQRDLLFKLIQESLQRILSTPDAPASDRPLIEMGLDSLMAVEFGVELQQMLGDQFAVGPTMLFDHPTIDAITDHVLELVANSTDDAPATVATSTDVVENTSGRSNQVREDVAIVGMSCRFPGARDINEFWQNLLNSVDSVGEIPEDRWDIDRFYSADREPGKMYTREGGFLDDIADFDAAFFNISDQEACWIDPQHRMLLENSYRALEDAGISPHPLTDANVGVFMGIMGLDYAFLPTLDDLDVIKAFQGAGLSHSAGVGRISYVFGFEGPSVAVDTASSSSLVALIQAVRSLQDGDCNMALAGGVNAILAPVNSLLMSKAGLLSPDGRCKSFSAEANGFGRGEGCGVVVLKRLSDAQRDGDRIMAVVRGGAVVHNGFSSGITAPSGKSQARVIGDAIKDARIAPSQVQYLEAHGTGTEYGDPMELGAAASVYGKGRQPDQPLLVGSVKANISHLEAAGGVSGLIKTVLALHHGVIPPQANFDEPSPHIPWQRLPVKMVTEATPWPDAELPMAGVTALGLVGTNAHVVLSSAPPIDSIDLAEEATDKEAPGEKGPAQKSVEPSSDIERTSQLLVLSARNENALAQHAKNYQEFINDNPAVNLADICHTAASGRRHFEHRVAVTVESHRDASQKLAAVFEDSATKQGIGSSNGSTNSNGKAHSNGKASRHPFGLARGFCKATPKLAWVFSGDRNDNLSSARELFATEPLFRKFIAELDQRLTEHLDATNQPEFRLQNWFENSGQPQPEFSDVHVFVLQAGLAKLWLDWGIEPDAVVGFGVGQYAATCVAGGLCFKDALVLAFERENVLTKLASESEAKNLENGQAFDESRISEESKTALDEFEALADKFNFYPPNLPLVCSVTGQEVPMHRSLGGSFWRQHCLAATKPEEAGDALNQMNCDYILEVCPVQNADAKTLKLNKTFTGKKLSSLSPNQTVTDSLLHSLGELYVAGMTPDFKSFDRHWKRNRISLPPYPFQKKRYWITEIAEHLEETETISN